MDKQIAIVILNWNGRELLERFLPSVIAHTPTEQADVIVADNGSTDDSLELLQAQGYGHFSGPDGRRDRDCCWCCLCGGRLWPWRRTYGSCGG